MVRNGARWSPSLGKEGRVRSQFPNWLLLLFPLAIFTVSSNSIWLLSRRGQLTNPCSLRPKEYWCLYPVAYKHILLTQYASFLCIRATKEKRFSVFNQTCNLSRSLTYFLAEHIFGRSVIETLFCQRIHDSTLYYTRVIVSIYLFDFSNAFVVEAL